MYSKLALLLLTTCLPFALHAMDDSSREKFHSAMQACIEENSSSLSSTETRKPRRREELTAEQKADRKIIEDCLKSKGFERPAKGPREQHPADRGAGQTTGFRSGEGFQ